MAKWQIMSKGKATTADHFDDGSQDHPGDETFNNAAALDHAKANGGDGVNYIGPSDAIDAA